MKKMRLLLSALSLVLLLASCAPVYKCGDPIPAKKSFFWSKQLKTVIVERDTLCSRLSAAEVDIDSLVEDTTMMGIKNRESVQTINSLGKDITNILKDNRDLLMGKDKLQKAYDDLQNEKLSESTRLNNALKRKSDELKEKESQLAGKEKLLAEREAKLKELQAIIAKQDSVSKRLDEILRKALLGFKDDELSVEMKNGKVYVSMSDKLLFKSGSATIESKGKEALKVLADVMVKNPDIDVQVEGHTDSIPIKTAVFKDNWDLSVIRATSIVRILTEEYDVMPTQVIAAGRSEYFPRATNETAEGRAMNRRTEIILSPDLDEVMDVLNNE